MPISPPSPPVSWLQCGCGRKSTRGPSRPRVTLVMDAAQPRLGAGAERAKSRGPAEGVAPTSAWTAHVRAPLRWERHLRLPCLWTYFWPRPHEQFSEVISLRTLWVGARRLLMKWDSAFNPAFVPWRTAPLGETPKSRKPSSAPSESKGHSSRRGPRSPGRRS